MTGNATQVTKILRANLQAPSEARRAFDDLEPRMRGETLVEARLLVSELVTNSVLHGPRSGDEPIVVRARLLPRGLRVEVRDRGSGFGFDRDEPPPVPDAVHGRGLQIVGLLASRWGVERGPNTTVWFELPHRSR